MSMAEEIKKYPVFYNGEEYEIRIENEVFVNIYKVKKHYNIFHIEKIKYIKVYYDFLNRIISSVSLTNADEDYYIKIFKTAFKLYLKSIKIKSEKEKRKNKQLTALQEWDGIIP